MIVLALLAAATPSAADAERTFAAAAQTQGQWTSFRAFAAADGIMFVPQQVNAQQWLKDRKDPPVPVMWWPGRSWTSCDGRLAVNTGPWVGGKGRGYFTTVWALQSDGGWKWLLDHGDALPEPRTATDQPAVRRASCTALRAKVPAPPPAHASGSDVESQGQGASEDGTLSYAWQVMKDGSRRIQVRQWNGRNHDLVVDDRVGGTR